MSRLRWWLVGPGGQLGHAVRERLRDDSRHALVATFDRAVLDLARPDAIEARLAAERGDPPDVVANAAAYTDVDRCESEPDESERVNAQAPVALARACRKLGARFVHVSTDYVFDGNASRPYTETDPTAPLSAYGRGKLLGEQGVLATAPDALVIRSSWLFGAGRNFVTTVLGLAGRVAKRELPELRVVDDQTGRPTYARDLADGIVTLVEGGCAGLYHLANSGTATWWDVARAALDHVGYADVPIARVRSEEFPRPARRPRWSVLGLEKAARAGVQLRPWPEALNAYLDSDHAPASGKRRDA